MAFDLGETEELQDLTLVQKQAAGAAWFVLIVAGFVISLDVHVVEPDLTTLDACKGITYIELALADGFDLCASEFDAAFVSFKDMIVPERFTVGGDFFSHEAAIFMPPAQELGAAR